jgi:hypothetical protein
MTNPLSHVGQAAQPEGLAGAEFQTSAPRPEHNTDVPGRLHAVQASAQDIHLGVRFKVQAVALDGLFEGRFTIQDEVPPGHGSAGNADSYRPSIDNRWATPAEALTYATEAAHHTIEGIRPFFTSGPPPGM